MFDCGLVVCVSGLERVLLHKIELITGDVGGKMVAPSAPRLVLCLLPKTEAAIEFDGVVAAFGRVWK